MKIVAQLQAILEQYYFGEREKLISDLHLAGWAPGSKDDGQFNFYTHYSKPGQQIGIGKEHPKIVHLHGSKKEEISKDKLKEVL
jgi:hypothetical protein